LLCLEHHRDYENLRFAIHPKVKTPFRPHTISIFEQTHETFAFHPATAALQGIEVKAPWDSPYVLYPPPFPAFLEMHYCIFIAKAMKGSGDDYELDDDDDDCEELPELEGAQNEQVIIWLDGSSSGRENHGDYVVISDLSQSAVNLSGVVRECRRSEIPLIAYGQCRFLSANTLLYP
jgi:hypothetical protein